MTPDAGELMALADELRATLHKTGKEWVYWTLIDRAEKAVRIAASQPDRPAPIGYISPETLSELSNNAKGVGPIVAAAAYSTVIPVYALSLLSVQVDGEQKIAPLTKQESSRAIASVPSPTPLDVERVARIICFARVGDPYARAADGRFRWQWWTEDAQKYLRLYPNAIATPLADKETTG